MADEPHPGWPSFPYKGLGYYTETDAPLLAGREDDVARCAAQFADWRTRLLLLHGLTACGKSSFLRAGLIPWLEGLGAGIEFARSETASGSAIMFLRSTGDPLPMLADAIFQFANRQITLETHVGQRKLNLSEAIPVSLRYKTAFRHTAVDNPEMLIDMLATLEKMLPATLVLMIDQGEEVLTANPGETGDKSRRVFFDFLRQFIQSKLDLKLVVALRTEYFGRFVSLSRQDFRGAGITEYFLAELNDDQVMEAIRLPTIERPVGKLGSPRAFYRFTFEEGVIDRLLNEVGRTGGKLPALQIVCSRLHKQAISRPEPWVITRRDLDDARGVKGHIESYLDDQLYKCAERRGLRPVDCAAEIEIWKKALCGLVRAQPDGTVTTELKPETELVNELSGSKLDFFDTAEWLAGDDVKVLRRVTVINTETLNPIPCYGLGHDVLGLVLRNWKLRVDQERRLRTAQLIENVPDPDLGPAPTNDIALCLSSGGYRAMLFHTGVLWRLNELGYLQRLAKVSGVSAGSIVAGVLGMQWSKLQFDNVGTARNFIEILVDPIRTVAGTTIGSMGAFTVARAFLGGDRSASLANALSDLLFKNTTLQDLPDEPRCILNATNLQSGALFRFSKPYMGDYRVGRISKPQLPLARAVAASAANPGMYSPAILHTRETEWDLGSGSDMQLPKFTDEVHLTDGGVYDSLGLEPVWNQHRTILISDAGSTDSEPTAKTDFISQLSRIVDIIDHQKRALRRAQVLAALVTGKKSGAYWNMQTGLSDFNWAQTLLPVEPDHVRELASIPSSLEKLDDATQERLINWGYAVCDAAVRGMLNHAHPHATAFPYPVRGV
jgi:NTE family protein